MEINHYKLKLYKVNYLQNKYNDITKIINNVMNHIDFLDSIYYIDFMKKKEILTNLFDINTNINSIYNQYILEYIEKNELVEKNIDILNHIDDNNLALFFPIYKIFSKSIPYEKELSNLVKIVNNTGCDNLLLLLEMNKINYNNYSSNLIKLIEELVDIFIPTHFSEFKLNLKTYTEFYWRVPTIYSSDDILELTRELWIKKNNKIYYKIEGIFKSDILSIKLKTSQLLSNYLYNKKFNVIEEVKKKNCDIDLNFTKKFIRYDYIGNIYCMNLPDYINYLASSYKLYLQLIKSSFINIMKNFITNGTKLYNLYYIIFLLLLGNDDNADVASLLINLTKEKKINSLNLYNLINKNLSFYMQLKIKKGSNNIKEELDRIKSFTIESVDYKKQLLSIKNIPNYVKNLTLEKIDEMKAQNNEYYKQKIFVEHILKYPWGNNSDSPSFLNIESSREYLQNLKIKLDNLTYGHNEAKTILLEIIANWITNPKSGGKPLGFVGPPGVGKTLLAKSISKALDIPYAEITLGGQNDGELLHGHGYTYSGSQPGLIVKKMVDMGKDRCILYFDELDKTASKHGNTNEITNILIHLTDPNMNKSFQDRFFQGIDFPLDKVIMIFSYNDAEKIDPVLLDRITQIKINPYTINDKISIIKNFVIPELKININIDLNFSDDIIEYIIENYTNEAGIRDIKRKIEKIFMTINLEKLINHTEEYSNIITIDKIKKILLKPNKDINKINEKPDVGIINGLYATTTGEGGIIPIQIYNNFSSKKFEIKLTGKQGDVMKESVQCSLTCALNYLNTKIPDFNDFYNKNFKKGFHIHTPSTATPKDGPSAGCAFTCAFISRILNKPISNEIGMTGEIELTGKITKIGGLNFKLFGAKKAGIKIVYIPKENAEDLNEIIEKDNKLIDENFNVYQVDYVSEIIDSIIK